MGQFNHSAATLRLFGETLDPSEVTILLGCQPSVAKRMGEVTRDLSGRERIAKYGQWRLEAVAAKPGDIESQIRDLLNQVSDDMEVWKRLSENFDIDIFCGLFMQTANDGLSLSPELMLMLGQRGIALSLDVYEPMENGED
jgi:Domain of unknown function (DUF4279)